MYIKFGAMHFIYQINRPTTTKVDPTYLGWLANNAQRICPVTGLERMTTGLAVSAIPYLATQVDNHEILTVTASSDDAAVARKGLFGSISFSIFMEVIYIDVHIN